MYFAVPAVVRHASLRGGLCNRDLDDPDIIRVSRKRDICAKWQCHIAAKPVEARVGVYPDALYPLPSLGFCLPDDSEVFCRSSRSLSWINRP